MRSHGVFDYSPCNVAGGKTRVPVTLGPRKPVQLPRGGSYVGTQLINTEPKGMNSDECYVSRTQERTQGFRTMSWSAYKALTKAAKHQSIAQPHEETLDEWCKRHFVLGTTTAECSECGTAFYGPSAIADATAHMQMHLKGQTVVLA